ncbi:DDT domain-containing protein DDR4-like [Zingiber officinale]|uniref:DDT domain-containing protein DDR4 n=1 Tax=Zingiber officinale TaxID=94328 RepID=A0A8J5HU46_ZINOF|nr:DDT domain-containing protein DDR4-like [Zingiber officinale]KAG6531572.1 hypothetical protein ZIOFF_005386 [Zingiber officinale]
MAAKRRRRAGSTGSTSSEEAVVIVFDSERHQLERLRLRQRWELASVLNFLHVFEPVIQSDLNISAEEIETALISANTDLGRIHVSLLKGIPPVSKNLKDNDAWITIVCKKLDPWWPWVSEGENPLKHNHGEEIKKYKELDPSTRLVILRALCEVRAEQDDVIRHITDALKAGEQLTTFRKEKISSDENGITYWYDGDPKIGHRLYKEVVQFDSKAKLTGKCSSMLSEWETIATNLKEFRETSEKLSSSMSKTEAFVAKKLREDILPVLEEIQKKKERIIKRKQRHAASLDNFQAIPRIGINRICRQRKPVNYTYDDFDRSISEAIVQMSKKLPTIQRERGGGKQDAIVSCVENQGDDKRTDETDCDAMDAEFVNSNLDNGNAEQESSLPIQIQIGDREKFDSRKIGSRGNLNQRAEKAHAKMRTRLRQRPTANPDYSSAVVPDSDDDMADFS